MGVEGVSKGVASDAGKRSQKRARVLLAASLRVNGAELSVRLRDLSSKGALIETPQAVAEGSHVVFTRGTTIVPGRVAWAAGNRIGLEFIRPIAESEVLVHIGKPTHKPNETYRRPRIMSEDMTDKERALVRAWGMNVGISVGRG